MYMYTTSYDILFVIIMVATDIIATYISKAGKSV